MLSKRFSRLPATVGTSYTMPLHYRSCSTESTISAVTCCVKIREHYMKCMKLFLF